MSIDSPWAVRISHLKFFWPKAQAPTVDIESLNIQRGQKWFIQGPSGQGKSTLLNLIAGVLTPTQGELEVLGHDLQSMSVARRDQLRGQSMGFIFQQFNLLPYLNAMENVIWPLYIKKSPLLKTHSQSSLSDQAQKLLMSLDLDKDEMGSKPVMELSVGQQQRVAAARALISQPELLIADEPTSALDADSRQSFIQTLLRQSEEISTQKYKMTVIFVSHDSSLSKFFDGQYLLKKTKEVKPEVSGSGGTHGEHR